MNVNFSTQGGRMVNFNGLAMHYEGGYMFKGDMW